MSMTGNTTNGLLPIGLGSDNVSIFDINAICETIDSLIKALQVTDASNTETITSLTNSISELSTALTNLTSQVTTNTNNISTNASNITNVKNSLSSYVTNATLNEMIDIHSSGELTTDVSEALTFNGKQIGTAETGRFIVFAFSNTDNRAVVYHIYASGTSSSYANLQLKGSTTSLPEIWVTTSYNLRMKGATSTAQTYRLIIFKM